MTNIDFHQIVPKCGGKQETFEELCCQLAHRSIPEDAIFTRLYGAGGDGGVECFSDSIDGKRTGWQAKFVFDINSLIKQATDSLTTALQIHPTLTTFILCFPFDLTGPTARRGKSGIEKFEAWRKAQIQMVEKQGRTLEIEPWSATKLRSLLITFDVSGGMAKFFFDKTILSPQWFADHLKTARETAGPRYTPELNVHTDVGKWLAAFGRTLEWHDEFDKRLKEAKKKQYRLNEAINRTSRDTAWPQWPDSLKAEAVIVLEMLQKALDNCSVLRESQDRSALQQTTDFFEKVLSNLSNLESKLVDEIEQKHGAGRADSPGFRQFMAEYEVSFPAANLDTTRETLEAFRNLFDWLKSPEGYLAFHCAFVLSGEWGAGKTHGACDVAFQRLKQQFLSCIVFGHQFGGEPDIWTRLAESLGLPVDLGKDGILDALNAAGEASGQSIILFIDAINETRPLQYWQNRLGAVVSEIQRRSNLRICFTCRTPYLSYCLPDALGLPIVEHPGFKGVEQIACKAFFRHYGLKPPVSPILQPELANPFYLKLVCETLKARGMSILPAGWTSTAQVIAAFLEEREKEFSREKSVSSGARVVTKSLQSVARAIAESSQSQLRWSEANRVICESCKGVDRLGVLEWLVGANLLIEDAPYRSTDFGIESTVRPAFERLGDFLIALELLTHTVGETSINSVFKVGGQLHSWVQNKTIVKENYGALSALSILIPERYVGKELSDLVDSEEVQNILAEIILTSIPWRDPISFSSATQNLILNALRNSDLCQLATNSVLSVTWRPSVIDAIWFNNLLRRLPLAQRDEYWCGYLHQSYEQNGPIRRLIDATFELPLNTLDLDVAERWTIALLWFTAASDRRVKDRSTRAIIKILPAHASIIPKLINRFLSLDDDEVRERLLLASYGALIISRDSRITGEVAQIAHDAFENNPLYFENALIRDHIRCIGELALKLNVLPAGCDPQLTVAPIKSEWPLDLPTDDQVEKWGGLLRFKPNEFFSDFFKYSMGCLRPWQHSVSKENMGKWILQRIAQDFGYERSHCHDYDRYMLGKYGGGRAKPTWAERIGKKYQWIAMYQLASRLHDHVEMKRDSWEPKLLCKPLILLDERKMDPTISLDHVNKQNDKSSWLTSAPDLDPDKRLTDAEWVAREKDIPSLNSLLSITEHAGQKWLPLVSYPNWGRKGEDDDSDAQYRNVWMHLHSYLVKKKHFQVAYDSLCQRNFFGDWMPKGASWLYGFAGEYPWATSFNTERDEWHGRGGRGDNLSVQYYPSWNSLTIEWEYDASLPESYHLLLPAKVFFKPSHLWWDGKDGYRLKEGRTVFRDPSITDGGFSSLLVDVDDLLDRLDKLGLRLIWTVLGKKWILGGPHDKKTPIRTFSQVAYLNKDGSLKEGKRVFFDDYNQDAGPLMVIKSKTKSSQIRLKQGVKTLSDRIKKMEKSSVRKVVTKKGKNFKRTKGSK